MNGTRYLSHGRRRFLGGLAGAAGAWVTGCALPKGRRQEFGSGVYEWSGIGFGTMMSMEVHGVDEAAGKELGAACESIIAAHEKAFSLYRNDSELSRLNRERKLDNPSGLFRQLFDMARKLEVETSGYYQPAIHGAWQWLEARGFQIPRAESESWMRHCEAFDGEHFALHADGSIRLTHPLVKFSMNAIGQGFLADSVARHLREMGVACALLHLGETVAIGRHPAGRSWRLAVKGTGADADLVGQMELADAGLAVSANEPARILIDPVGRSLLADDRVAAVVSSRGAAVADAYATALAIAPEAKWSMLCRKLGGDSKVAIWQDNEMVFSA